MEAHGGAVQRGAIHVISLSAGSSADPVSTKLLGLLTQRFQMPQVVGALLAGLILGPAGLNVLTETDFISQLSELGVIVLMFSAGMGTDINELKNSGKAGFWVALLGVIVPLAMGTALAWAAAAPSA